MTQEQWTKLWKFVAAIALALSAFATTMAGIALWSPAEEAIPRASQCAVYTEQGCAKYVVATGGELEIQSGGIADFQSGATVGLPETTVTGNLTVTGNTSWGCSATSITGSMTISGSTILSGSLVCSSTATFEDAVVTDTLTTKSLSVDGGVLNVGGGSPGSAAGDNDLYVTADLEVDGTFYADGAAAVAGDLTVTGDILGKTNVISKAASYTLLAAESGSLCTNIGAPAGGFTYTLPGAAIGLNFCFSIGGTEVMTIAVPSGDQVYHITDTSGDTITNTTTGDQLCIVAIDTVY